MSLSLLKNHRSVQKLLIYPKFQLLLIGINLGVIAMTMFIFWVSSQNAINDLAPVAGLSGIEVEYYKQYLSYQSTQANKALFVSLFLGTLISGGLTLIISHRIAGPIVRMRNYFRALHERPEVPPTLEFRDGDFLTDLPPLVNDAVGRVVAHHEASKEKRHSRAS